MAKKGLMCFTYISTSYLSENLGDCHHHQMSRVNFSNFFFAFKIHWQVFHTCFLQYKKFINGVDKKKTQKKTILLFN